MNFCTIVITRYSETKDLVVPCVESLACQKKCNCTVLFLDQKRDKETKNLCKNLSNPNVKFIYKNIPAISLSYARELGTKMTKTEIVLFSDADAILHKNWAFELVKTFDLNKNIGIVGGKSEPKWLSKKRWYHNSNIIQDIYSLIDLSEKPTEAEKIVGVNFGLNKKRLNFEEYFNQHLGRKPGSLQGGEETDLCRRVIEKNFKVYYTPFAIVQHQIQKERMSLFWVMKRFYYGGYSKAKMGGIPKTYSKKRNIYDWLVLAIIIIPYTLGFLMGKRKK